MSVPYSFISPTILQQIQVNYQLSGILPQGCLPNQIHACMEQNVIDAEKMIRPRFNGSVIQIWDATIPSNPSLLSRPFIPDAALKNLQHLRDIDHYFRSVHRQPPINDGKGLIRSFLNHPQAYNNAYWNPATRSIYFGLVDLRIFVPFANNQEITTHEIGHAVTDLSSRLEYRNQSGALNESLSDVFAIMQKHWKNNSNSAASPNTNWLIGEGVVAVEDGRNQSLRSMSHPGTAYSNHPFLGSDPQSGHMDSYVYLPESNDYGAVHTNSGIPNRAFYLAATKQGGPSWNVIGQIWYKALISSESADDFAKFAKRTIEIAGDKDHKTADLVAQAWHEVGIDLRNMRIKQQKT